MQLSGASKLPSGCADRLVERHCRQRLGLTRRHCHKRAWSVVRAHRTTGQLLAAGFAPPSVSETKTKFLELYPKPVPALYNTVIQELLVQQHFMRYNIRYKYDEIFALGLMSALDQILDGFPGSDKDQIIEAYLKSLGEDVKQYRDDAASIEKSCADLDGIHGLVPNPEGGNTPLQKKMAAISSRASKGDFLYTKFFAVGLFRILELTGLKDPQALDQLVSSLGVELELVNRDLKLYKNILTKLSSAKEMMREFLEREKKKAAEREQEKLTKAEPDVATKSEVKSLDFLIYPVISYLDSA